MLMESCHLKPCFLPAVAPLCFSGELPLETGQFLLGFCEILVVGVFNAVRGSGKRLSAHVKTNSNSGRGQLLYFHIGTAQGDKVFPTGVFRYCSRQDAAFDLF